MVEEFADEVQPDAHRQFQQWRREHPLGFFINQKSGKDYVLHTVRCQHPGNTEWGAESGASLTRKTKICSLNISELEKWTSTRGFSLRRCQDCSPSEPATNYVAYHSAEVMGCEYVQTSEHFDFFTRKAESFLRRAIGCPVWVIASVRDGARATYRLSGVFTLSEIQRASDGFNILGVGTPFCPPFEVSTLPWFAELFREQNKFSFGFNPIRSAHIIAELQSFLEAHGGESVLQPDEFALPSSFVEGATRQVSVNRYERNPYARQQCIKHHGCHCSVCGFDFAEVYGELGGGFIHVHHLKQLAEIQAEYEVDPIEDLRPVCPNCHAMIHRGATMATIEDLRKLFGRAKRRK